MRALLLLPLIVLSGCASIARLDSDSFEIGRAGVEAFQADDSDCRLAAQDYVAYDLHVIGDTRYAANRAYNAQYRACMHGHGHADRAYARNWLPG